MYFESRIYQTRLCKSIAEVATIIKDSGERRSYDAFTVDLTKKKQLIIVDDGNIDCPFLEVAVLINEDGKLTQVESISAGWIKTSTELAKYFQDAVKEPAISKTVILNLGTAKPETMANFTCGCCGSWFKGNVAYQQQFDQDSSYGICKDCEKYYL